MEVLSEQQCQLLLGTKDIGRIAFSVGGVPEIFPVNYAADRSTVVFRTAEGTRLQRAVMLRVAFEVDDWDPATGTGWSIVVKGVAQGITSGIDPFAIALRGRQVAPQGARRQPGRDRGTREYWIAIYPSEITGRRFGRD